MMKSLTQGLEEQAAKEIAAEFKASPNLRKRLQYLTKKKIEESLALRRSKVTYDSPNWVYLQADQNGYERALEEIFSLLT